jgi:hypothetical protein
LRILAFVLIAASSFAAEIPTGAHVLLRLQITVNTRSAQPGDYVYFQTTTPIAADNKIVVPPGSHVQGVVITTDRGGRVKGRAHLGIRLETLTLATGQQYKIRPRIAASEGDETTQRVIDEEGTIQQGSGVEHDIAEAAKYAGSGAIIGLFVGNWGGNISSNGTVSRGAGSYARGMGLGAAMGAAVGLGVAMFTRGKDVELRQGSGIDIVFDRAVELQ